MKISRARTAMLTCVAATAALMIVGPSSGAALAGRMIGTEAIKDNSVRTVDIRNGSLGGWDVKDGSLRAKDFSGVLRGEAGPAGPAGPAGADGEDGANGPAGTTGASGARGPAGSDASAGIQEFLYLTNDVSQTVAMDTDLTFNSDDVVTSGFEHTQGTSTVTVNTPGFYEVAFSVSGIEPNQFAVFTNGVVTPGTVYGSGAGTQQNNGYAIVAFSAGDVVSLRNHGSQSAVSLQTLTGGTNENVNASLTIKKISQLVP